LSSEYIEDDFDHIARELVDKTSGFTWAVYRAIGMRPDPGSDELLHSGLADTHSVDRGVAALALARRQGSAALDAVTTAFQQATESVESIMAGLAVLRLDNADANRSMIIDRLVRDSDTVIHLNELLFNDVVSELERPGDPHLIDLAYTLRWLRLRP
jgi:hypothetical protein